MEKLIIASMRQSAGKTSVIVGLAKALKKKIGYMKPFGDRLIYQKKQLWDYDAALITNIFDLHEPPAEISIGFDSSKLRYMYDEASLQTKLNELLSDVGKNKDVVFVEGGRDIRYGTSLHLDALSLGRSIEGKILIVVSGDDDTIIDDIAFLRRYVEMTDINFGGVIINKVHDVEDFKNVHLSVITDMGIKVVGILPYDEKLTYFTVDYIAKRLFAKIIAGEDGLKKVVKNIVVGGMSASTALRYPPFQKENKVVITGGDRSDMILASLETNAAGVILTGNILPPPNIISKASERSIPLLLISSDTYQTAKQIESIESLLTPDNIEQIHLWEQLVKDNITLTEIMDI